MPQPSKDSGRYAPDYNVPEGVSPFRPLPILTRCKGCGSPENPLALYSAVRLRKFYFDLCARCAA